MTISLILVCKKTKNYNFFLTSLGQDFISHKLTVLSVINLINSFLSLCYLS